MRLVPGDAVDAMISTLDITGHEDMDEMRAKIEHQLGLDLPFHIYYLRWLGNALLRGDLGNAIFRSYSVTEEV